MKKTAAHTFLAVLVVPIILGCDCCDPDPPIIVTETSNKVAVLASAWEATADDELNDSQFWYDLVSSYCTLIDNGFNSDNIFVLYNDGTDAVFSKYDAYSSPYCGQTDILKIVDFSLDNAKGGAKDNLCNVLCCLSTGFPATLTGGTCECLGNTGGGIGGFTCASNEHSITKLGEQGFLFTWIKGHGNATDCNNVTLSFKPLNATDQNPKLGNKELAGLIKGIEDNRKAMIFETCDSGGWLGELQNSNTAVTASSGDPLLPSNCNEASYPGEYAELPGDEQGIFHGRFSHGFNAAMRKLDSTTTMPIDADKNNLISIRESFDEAVARIEAENAIISLPTPPVGSPDYGEAMNPAIRIEDGIAPCLFIRLPHPGKDHEIFAKDHDDDDAIEPSSTDAPGSPDLWVSESATGSPPTNSIKKGGDYHLFVRVHNIGCADQAKVTATFSIIKSDGSGSETPVATDFIPALPVNSSSLVVASWSLPLDADIPNDEHFLIASLSTDDDTPTADASVAGDNNKAQIKIAIVP